MFLIVERAAHNSDNVVYWNGIHEGYDLVDPL